LIEKVTVMGLNIKPYAVKSETGEALDFTYTQNILMIKKPGVRAAIGNWKIIISA